MNTEPKPLSLIERDQVWRLSELGDDTRANTEFSCLPQNETTIAVNPTNPRNVIGAQNDYRLGGPSLASTRPRRRPPPDENQWLVVRSQDGGATWQGPWFVTSQFDVNFRARADCGARGAGSSLTNSSFRIPMTGAVVVDRRGGVFADDLYLVTADNRNGTRNSTNTDVFMFKSTTGGSSWVGPTRVNDDRSEQPEAQLRARRAASVPGGHAGLRQRQLVAVGRRLRRGRPQRRDEGSTARHGLGPPRVAEQPAAAGQLPRLDVGGSMPRPGVDDDSGARLRRSLGRGDPAADRAGQPGERAVPGADGVPVPGLPGLGRAFELRLLLPGRCLLRRLRVDRRLAYGRRRPRPHGGGPGRAWILFNDARNGRSSGGPAGGSQIPSQPGRNPICEQSDVFVDSFNARNGGSGGRAGNIQPFLITPCPGADD